MYQFHHCPAGASGQRPYALCTQDQPKACNSINHLEIGMSHWAQQDSGIGNYMTQHDFYIMLPPLHPHMWHYEHNSGAPWPNSCPQYHPLLTLMDPQLHHLAPTPDTLSSQCHPSKTQWKLNHTLGQMTPLHGNFEHRCQHGNVHSLAASTKLAIIRTY